MTTPEHAPTYRHDLEEALLAMSANCRAMREAGIDERFAKTYAKHAHRFELLPESTRQQIAEQFSRQAAALSNLEGVGRKHSEEKERALAAWFKGVLLFLVLQSKGLA